MLGMVCYIVFIFTSSLSLYHSGKSPSKFTSRIDKGSRREFRCTYISLITLLSFILNLFVQNGMEKVFVSATC